MGRNFGDEYRSNSSSLCNVKLDHSLSYQDHSEANLLERSLNRGCLSNLDQRSMALAKRTKSTFSNYDKFKNECFNENSEWEDKNLKINRYMASKMDSNELKDGFKFNNVRNFGVKKNDVFFLNELDYFSNPFANLSNFPHYINFKN